MGRREFSRGPPCERPSRCGVDGRGGSDVGWSVLAWFGEGCFPLYLAPMAGVTDVIFRQLCKELGADVMVTEFVSAEGILQRDERTRKYTEFTEEQRPVGVQLFGADGARMGEAAKKIIEWKRPDFIDINFGCPVNKVVAKNGGSCPRPASLREAVSNDARDHRLTVDDPRRGVRTIREDRPLSGLTFVTSSGLARADTRRCTVFSNGCPESAPSRLPTQPWGEEQEQLI